MAVKQSSLAFVAALAILCLPSLRANTLFSNLGQSTNVSFGNNIDNTSYRLATDFLTGASPTSITNATLRLENPDNIGHNYTLSLFTDNGAGKPGSFVGSFNTTFVVPLANPPRPPTASALPELLWRQIQPIGPC